MAEHNPFDTQLIQDSAYARPDGLLEQLGLPPELIRFLRANKQMAWTLTVVLVTGVVLLSLYGSYRDYRADKASDALHKALAAPEAEREQQLQAVSSTYSRTGAGTWSRVELALLAAGKAETDKAIEGLSDLQKKISPKDPLYPLLVNKLAVLYADSGKIEQSIAACKELQTMPGFVKEGSFQLGRLLEEKGDKEQAKAAYERFLQENGDKKGAEGMAGQGGPPSDPMTLLVQSRLNRLAQ